MDLRVMYFGGQHRVQETDIWGTKAFGQSAGLEGMLYYVLSDARGENRSSEWLEGSSTIAACHEGKIS